MSDPLAQLKQLVAEGESEQLELKRSTGSHKEGMQTICGFLNCNGGRLLFGVTQDGQIQGQRIGEPTLRDLSNSFRRLEPPIRIKQEVVSVGSDLGVLILEVPAGESGPYTYDGRAFLRVGSTTQRMPRVEFERRLVEKWHSQQRWENQIAEGYALRHLDRQAIQQTLSAAVEAGRLESTLTGTGEALDRLGLRFNRRLLRAGRCCIRAPYASSVPAMQLAAC